jgi:hypothetical protein
MTDNETRTREIVAKINKTMSIADYGKPGMIYLGGDETRVIASAFDEAYARGIEDCAVYCEQWETEGKRLASALRALLPEKGEPK